MPTLSASSYVVLGLLEHDGPATPYQLDRAVARSIGYFWAFPRSQLYAEATRLTRYGLLSEHRENTGRRRRLFTITAAGRRHLHDWLAHPAAQPTEIRDEGLLRLFFSRNPRDHRDDTAATTSALRGTIRELADHQADAHRDQLARYEQLLTTGAVPDGSPQHATLELGLRFERLAITFWTEIHQHPPTTTLLDPEPAAKIER